MSSYQRPIDEDFQEVIRIFRPDTQERLIALYRKDETRWKARDEDFYAWAEDTSRLEAFTKRLRKRIKLSEQRIEALERYRDELRKSA